MNNVGKGKEILSPVAFQGGVAANLGLVRAFNKYLGFEVVVPRHHAVMGAIGAAYLAREAVGMKGRTSFKGFDLEKIDFKTTSFECKGCSNACEVVQFFENKNLIARWGDRCGKWELQVG